MTIRPLILAGGLGTRLRPRTLSLPKPLLPIAGRPLLWYTIQSVSCEGFGRPLVMLDYLGNMIEAFFDGEAIDFITIPNTSMAEKIIRAAETCQGDISAFLGMSSDVLVPPAAVSHALREYCLTGERDLLLLTTNIQQEHKKWEFILNGSQLADIQVRDKPSGFERVLLILRRDSLAQIGSYLSRPVTEQVEICELRGFQTGWILLKALLKAGITVNAKLVDFEVCNINVPNDFALAKSFVSQYYEFSARGEQ
jgi:NDP-sugar pyrophosphorylase family protein